MAEFHCPTKSEILQGLIGLLPRGRAWQTHTTGPLPGHGVGYDPAGFQTIGFQTEYEAGSVLWQFWASVAELAKFVTDRLCALRLEFWCATMSETRDQWMTEYGLPDACDPFPDLCVKVAAIGGTNCAYYAYIAARSGWAIRCETYTNDCGARAGCGKAGKARPGRRRSGYLRIVVDLPASSAFTGNLHARPKAGRLKAGRRLGCGPSISALECILARVVHAEIEINYEVTTP